MKSLIKIFLILTIFASFFSNSSSFAASGTISDPIEITVTESIPGANCRENSSKTGTYTCEIKRGFGSISDMAGAMIKYLTYLVGIGAVLFIVLNGIMYSMSGLGDSMKTKAKERIGKTLLGLIVLLLSGVILNIIAPWIYK